MRLAVTMTLALGLAACSTASMPAGGYATYDALSRAQADCAAKGGTFQLKPQGDAQYLDAYACRRD